MSDSFFKTTSRTAAHITLLSMSTIQKRIAMEL